MVDDWWTYCTEQSYHFCWLAGSDDAGRTLQHIPSGGLTHHLQLGQQVVREVGGCQDQILKCSFSKQVLKYFFPHIGFGEVVDELVQTAGPGLALIVLSRLRQDNLLDVLLEQGEDGQQQLQLLEVGERLQHHPTPSGPLSWPWNQWQGWGSVSGGTPLSTLQTVLGTDLKIIKLCDPNSRIS